MSWLDFASGREHVRDSALLEHGLREGGADGAEVDALRHLNRNIVLLLHFQGDERLDLRRHEVHALALGRHRLALPEAERLAFMQRLLGLVFILFAVRLQIYFHHESPSPSAAAPRKPLPPTCERGLLLPKWPGMMLTSEQGGGGVLLLQRMAFHGCYR